MGPQIRRLGTKLISSRKFPTRAAAAKEVAGESTLKPGYYLFRLYGGMIVGLGAGVYKQYHNEGKVTSILGFRVGKREMVS